MWEGIMSRDLMFVVTRKRILLLCTCYTPVVPYRRILQPHNRLSTGLLGLITGSYMAHNRLVYGL